MNLWQCPHPALFLKEICATLDTMETHCIVSMPGRFIPSFQEELLSCWRDTRGRLPLLLLEKESSLIDALSPLFIIDRDLSSLADLKESMLKGSSTLAVVLPDQPLPIEHDFFDFLKKDLVAHAKNCRDNACCLDWNMLVIAPADRDIPAADIGLKCFYWWGRLHNSDLEYAIENTFQDSFGDGAKKERLDYWWLYPLCKGIAISDPELVETIHRNSPQDMDTLMASLADHELNTDENGKLVKKFLDSTPYKLTRNDRPQGLAAKLWHKGILDLNCQGGIALHPAALLAAGCQDELEKLIIRGQMQFFLPLIQEVHALLSRQVEKYLGGFLKDYIPNDGKLDSALYEIGPFYALLSYLYKEKGKTLPSHIVITAKHWHDLRNDIAHIKMLSYQNIDKTLDLYERLLAAS